MKTALVLCLIIIGLTEYAQGQLTWIEKISNGTKPAPRNDAGLGYYDDKIVLFGGRGSAVFSDTWIYHLKTEEWTDVSEIKRPEERFSFVYGVHDKYFYVSTGERTSGFLNDVWQFDFTTYKWIKLSTNSIHEEPATRYGSAGGVSGGLLYVSLGFASVRYGDTFVFDVTASKPSWKRVGARIGSYSGSGPHPRCLHSGALVSKTDLMVFGGCLSGGKTGGPCPSSDSWLLNGQVETWTQLDNCATPRMYSSMASLPRNGTKKGLILYGGNENTKQTIQFTASPGDEVGFYDPDLSKWSMRKVSGSKIPKKRAHAAMTTGEDGIYMFGGAGVSDLWLLKGDIQDARKSPDTKACNRSYFNFLTLHGIFMLLGWGIFLQAGAFIARYMRDVRPPLWFLVHRVLQVSGVALSVIGFAFAHVSVLFDHYEFAHAIIGLIVFILGLQQPLNGFLRPHQQDNQPVTKLRFIWEIVHKNTGRVALILALVNITLGLYLAVAARALRIVWYVYLILIIVAYVVAEGRRLWKRNKKGVGVM